MKKPTKDSTLWLSAESVESIGVSRIMSEKNIKRIVSVLMTLVLSGNEHISKPPECQVLPSYSTQDNNSIVIRDCTTGHVRKIFSVWSIGPAL